jgi:hypothetical protein
MSVTKQNSMKLRLHLQAMQAKVDAANDKVATLERRLAAESGLLDEAILFLHTIGCGLLPWATGQDMMSNFHDKLISVRAAAAKGDKESK